MAVITTVTLNKPQADGRVKVRWQWDINGVIVESTVATRQGSDDLIEEGDILGAQVAANRKKRELGECVVVVAEGTEVENLTLFHNTEAEVEVEINGLAEDIDGITPLTNAAGVISVRDWRARRDKAESDEKMREARLNG